MLFRSVSYLGVQVPNGIEGERTDLIANNAGASEVVFTYYKKLVGDIYTEIDAAPKNAGSYKVVVSAEEGSNYTAAASVEKTFEIRKRNITIKAADANKTYDGTALTKNEYKVMNTLPDEGLAKPEGKIADQITTITITGSQTDCGTSANKASGAKIQVGDKNGEDVTDNYDIKYVDGTLKVTEATATLKITTTFLDKVYDGVVIDNPIVPYTGVGGGSIKDRKSTRLNSSH